MYQAASLHPKIGCIYYYKSSDYYIIFIEHGGIFDIAVSLLGGAQVFFVHETIPSIGYYEVV